MRQSSYTTSPEYSTPVCSSSRAMLPGEWPGRWRTVSVRPPDLIWSAAGGAQRRSPLGSKG
jgi:hypothetical protein